MHEAPRLGRSDSDFRERRLPAFVMCHPFLRQYEAERKRSAVDIPVVQTREAPRRMHQGQH
ncbi:MAG: hypothetical protein VX478_04235, partial [Chloroflexota bacterium]|nr:hypothetical protein [Chloroflexota bacterium]